MSADWRGRVADWLPPIVLRGLGRRLRGARYVGGFASFAEAAAGATGHADIRLLRRLTESALKVTSGEVAAERDGVPLREVAHRWPVVAGLLRAAASAGNRLRVVDFGGGLGSLYFQCRGLLDSLAALDWCVVELPHVAQAGRCQFEDGRLRFHDDLAASLREGPADVLLLSSVLQYLEQPRHFVQSLPAGGFRSVLVDRTPMWDRGADRPVLQRVARGIHGFAASYPAWILDRRGLLEAFGTAFALVAEFQSDDGPFTVGGRRGEHRGFLLAAVDPRPA